MNLNQINNELESLQPRDIIKSIYTKYDHLEISFSGAEDVVLIDMAVKLGFEPVVFCLDTGRLHPETYRYIQAVADHYKLTINIISPDATQLQKLTSDKGLFSFYKDGHSECCGIRKVASLKKHLKNVGGWITGQRRDQSKATRNDLSVIEEDTSFEGCNDVLLKFNPLANWTSEQVWAYIRALEVPFNPLHNQGYISIGCEPCTRPTLPHQEAREGRWWWETEESKECGLHSTSTTD